MALFGSNKSSSVAVRKVRPTVVKSENIAKELSSIAKEYGIKPETLDFHILDVLTYTRFLKQGMDAKWEEIERERLREIDDETWLDPNFQIKQVYEVEIFSRQKGKDPLEEFKIAIGANATKCKIYMQVKEGSILRYISALKEELTLYINKHKVRAGILIYVFDEPMKDAISKLNAKAKIEESILFEKMQTYLIAESIEPTQTVDGTLILHFEQKRKEEEDGRVDYADRGFIQSVHKDELLIEFIKPRPGQPGRDCRGRYIAPKEPSEERDLGFEVDEETIRVEEDEKSIRFYAKVNGYIAIEENVYTIKSEADVNQVTFRTTGSITVGTDSDVNLVVTEADAVKDAIGTGMKVEVTELEVEGNVGSEAYVKAKRVDVGGQTHKTSVIEADEITVNVHKGTAKGKKVKITRLEHGVVEGEEISIAQAMGGRIYGEKVTIEICTSYVRVKASQKIEIKRLRGSENIFEIDPLQQRKAKESYEKNKEEIEKLKQRLFEYEKQIEGYRQLVKKNHAVFNEVKKRLLHYKKNGIKLPEAYVKQYKLYQAQVDKLKELEEMHKKTEEKIHLLSNQTGSLQYSVMDARVINRDVWRGYNEIRARLIDPPLELVYKPEEGEAHHIYGIVEVEEGIFEIRPLEEEDE